jgi:hypothetical protein
MQHLNATYLIPKLLNYQGCFFVLHGFGVFIHPVLGNNKWLDWLVPRALQAAVAVESTSQA